MSSQLSSRAKRRLLLRWWRGDPEVTTWQIHKLYDDRRPLIRAQRRRDRAIERLRQTWWLRLRRAEMEDILEEHGIPREAWRGVWFEGTLQEEPEPLHHVQMVLSTDSDLFRWFRAHRGEDLSRIHYVAATAWAAGTALQTRSPERRFVFGRLVEAFYANLLFPKRIDVVVKEIAAEHGAKGPPAKHVGKTFERDGWEEIIRAMRAESPGIGQREVARRLADRQFDTFDACRHFVRITWDRTRPPG